jgi:hypothetical protein
VRHPGGKVGEKFELKGTYEIKQDIVTIRLIFPPKEIVPKDMASKDFMIKGNTLVDVKGGIWVKK